MKIKALKNYRWMITQELITDFVIGEVYEVMKCDATSMVNNGFAKIVEGSKEPSTSCFENKMIDVKYPKKRGRPFKNREG